MYLSCSSLAQLSILQGAKSLKDLLPLVISAIVERAVEDIRQLKGITATYRMTNKPLPVRHSPYVSGLLRPLKTFLDGERATTYLTKELRYELLQGAAFKITELAADLVNVGAKLSIMEDGGVSMAETIEAFKKIDDQEDKGGNEVATFSLQEFLHENLEIKGSEKRARSTLESPTAPNSEEDVTTTGDNDPVEDAVVMDYAQPHRKPPIHNR
nr:conserved oligomeric Golgi complex subunit 2 [Ipomoea batatas]